MTYTEYIRQRPDLLNNWQNVHQADVDPNDPVVAYIRSFPSLEAYVEADHGQSFDAAPITAPPAVPPPATPPPPANPTVPPPSAGTPDATGAAGAGVGSAIADLANDVGATAGKLKDVGGNTNQVSAGSQTGTLNTNQATTGVNSTKTNQVNTSNGVNTTAGSTTSNNVATTSNNTNNTTQQAGTAFSNQQFGQLLDAITKQTTASQQNNQQQQSGTSATTSRPVDTVGFGPAMSGLVGPAAQADLARGAFLGDVMQTGGSGFNSQVDQAVRASLSGPGRTGIGESAAARAAGYAASDIARNNLGLRLQAASQLAGPSTLGTLTQQGNGLLGQTSNTVYGSNASGSTAGTSSATTSNTQQTSGSSSNNSGFSNTGQETGAQSSTSTNTGGTTNQQTSKNSAVSTSLGDTLQRMAGNTGTSSAATGSSMSAAAGNTPVQTTSGGGGGCYVCSALAMTGQCNADDVRRAVVYKLYHAKSKWMPIGYSIYGPKLARLVLKQSLVGRLLRPIALLILHEELRLAGRRSGLRPVGWALHFIFHNGSAVLGWFANKLSGRKFETRDASLAVLMQSHNLYYRS